LAVRLGPASLHGFVLAVTTLVAVMVGCAVYSPGGLRNQIAVQVLIAGVVCVMAFAVWGFVVHRLSRGSLSLSNLRELGVAYAAALLWAPVLFAPEYYINQGCLLGFGNILAIWLFQVPFNLLALMVANGRLMGATNGGTDA
jgi:hypothetical protein